LVVSVYNVYNVACPSGSAIAVEELNLMRESVLMRCVGWTAAARAKSLCDSAGARMTFLGV